MNYAKKVKLIAISMVASTFLVGCGGSDTTATVSTTAISGVAADPELQGATVFLDANENHLFDSGELSTTTDNLGRYTLDVPSEDIGKPIVVTGGIDRVTRKAFKGQLSVISEAGNNSQHITPLTTLVEKYKAANPTEQVSDIKASLATKLGLNADDFDKNVVATGNEKLLKVALRLQKVAEALDGASSKNIAELYTTLANTIKSDSNLTEAIKSAVSAEIASGTLDEAKILDLDNEINSLVVDSTTSTTGLALTVENIDENVTAATTITDLDANLFNDTAIIVDNTEELGEQDRRTINALGLGDLNASSKQNILDGFGSDINTDLKHDSVEDLRKRLDNNDLNLTSGDNFAVKREQFFNDNGLQGLDKGIKDNLGLRLEGNGFDFENANNNDFKNQLQDSNGSLFGNDEDLKAKIQGQVNQFNTTPSTTSLADGKLIVGSIIKGPIDGATMKLKDASGILVSATVSDKGIFVFPEQNLTSDYYTIESISGSYDDEATATLVDMNDSQGLKTLLTKEELTTILTNKEYIAITPETTIYTEIVQDDVNNNSIPLATAMSEAKALISAAMITATSPLSILPGDAFLQVGDFTTAFPKDAGESFAKNRAISFSYMVRDLNLTADKVFDVLDLVVADFKDGTADGIVVNGKDVNLTQEYGLARTKLFQNTTTKLREGNLSDGQKEQLKQMGIDTDAFGGSAAAADSNLTAIVDKYINATTLPTLHVLPTISDEDGNATDTKETYTLTATKNVNVNIQTPEGNWTTPMWRYNNNPLPVVIKTSKGTEMTLNLDNQLDSNSTIHWHGFQIPAIMDGGPDVPVEANATKAYTFTMVQQAAPLWFHPHPDMQTGKQVYMGLAGVYLLSDEVSKALEDAKKIPSGTKDTVLLVQDRRFTAEVNGVRELAYKTMDMDSNGMLGDTVLVNGSVLPKQEVTDTKHRYRLYNVSNARTYDFALSDGSDFTVIGTDGGLLQKPVTVNHIMLGAAERVEIVIDFAKYTVGNNVMLVSKPFNAGMMSMGQSGDGGTTSIPNMGSGGMNNPTPETDNSTIEGMLANGTGLAIMRFDVTSSEVEDVVTLYTDIETDSELSASITTRLSEADATNPTERQFLMSMGGMGTQNMSFVINNTPFDMTKVNEFVAAGAKEVWSIRNMSPMAHPFHAHAIQYQILTRNGVPASGTDLGWKDTFLVQPGETVRVIGDFATAEGDYMYHCHILEHEDAGMMGYFRVGDTGHLGAQ